MAYIINRFDGTQLTIVDDGVLDNSTPLGLIGRNYTGYGETQNENFVFLLENFANSSPPARALRGQIWYNTTEKALKTYNGTNWLSIGNATVAEAEPAHSSGGLWLNSVTNQMYVSDGTTWRLVGPEGVAGFAVTKMTSTKIKDSLGASKPVIISEINGETVAILTNESFVINSENAILGFDQLNKGINLKSDSYISGNLKGNADTASRFQTPRTINTVSFNGTEDIVITAGTNQALKPGDYILGSDFNGLFEDTWNIDATPENLIGKVVARDSTGSFSATTVSAGEFVGTLLGNVTTIAGTSTFNDIIVNRITGNSFSGIAARADRLTARRTINTVPFDGTEDIILPVPAETLTGNTLAPNIVASSLTTLGQLEYLNVEAPGITVGDGNNLNIKIEGFTPTIESDTTNILKLKLATGAVSTSPTTLTFLSASAAAADGVFAPAFVPDYTLGTAADNRPVLGLPSHRWRNIYSKGATLDTLNVTTLSGRTLADQVTVSKDLVINGTMFGSVTGSLSGAASLNVLKSGDTMTGDLVVGSITKSSNSVISVRAGDSFRAGFEAYGSNQGTGYLYIGQSTDYGGGVSYNGDNNPGFISGEQTDTITFFRRNAGTNSIVFEYPYNSDTVTFRGTVVGTFSGNGASITNINATNVATGTINAARLSGNYNINVTGNTTGTHTGPVVGNVTGNVTGNIVGNVTGNVTGSASLNVLKSGDTMTGDLTIFKENAWISLDSPSVGTDGTAQAAGISIGESGYKGSATLHMTYTGDGFGHIGMGPINGSTSLPQFEAIRLYYLDNTVRVLGNMTVAGTASGTFSGTGTSLDINAERMVIGTVPRSRLSGTYDVSITGNANYATSAGSAAANIQRSGDTMTGRLGQHVTGFHASSIGAINTRTNSGFFDNPAPTTAGGWPVTGSWYHLLSSTHVNDANYYAMQFSADFYGQNLYYRSTAGNGDTAWSKILHSNNWTDYAPTKTGSGASGTWAINITGQSNTVLNIPSSQIVNSLGYTPVNPGALTNQAGTAISGTTATFTGQVNVSTAGIKFPNDPAGGGGDTASITYEGISSDRTRLRFRISNDATGSIDDKAEFSTPDNDGLLINNNVVLNAANYNNYAPTKSGGGATGTWAINITGSAGSAGSVAWNGISGRPNNFVFNDGGTYSINVTGNAGTSTSTRFVQAPDGDRNPNTKLPTTSGQSVRFDFAQAGYTGTGGNYAGVMTYAPWTGTTSSTGDASYQLAFGSTAINGGGTPQLRIRKGIDSTWNSWYDLLTSANYNSYSPTLTGGNASGTWGINITGNAGTVSTVSGAQIAAGLGFTPISKTGDTVNGDLNLQDYNIRRATIIDYSLAHNALGNVSGSTTVNMEVGNYVSATAVGAVNWSFTNPPTGARLGSIILELTNGGAYTQYWPASVKWPSGAAPSLIAAGVDVLVFITDDGGINWRGAISMSDSR